VSEGIARNGDQLLATLSAIANPQRLRILAALAGGSTDSDRGDAEGSDGRCGIGASTV
jgi:DNA-binding transcriptional ArsR family regulator